MYIGGLGEGRSSKKEKNASFPWPPLPLREAIYIYTHTHYVCFFTFVFPGNLHDSLDILWQPLATCHQGEAMYIGGLGEGRSSKKAKKIASFPWPPLPLREAIYIYTHRLCLFLLTPPLTTPGGLRVLMCHVRVVFSFGGWGGWVGWGGMLTFLALRTLHVATL